MSALDNAKAALTTMERLAQDDWCLCVQNGAANEVEEALRVLIAEHERLLAEQAAPPREATVEWEYLIRNGLGLPLYRAASLQAALDSIEQETRHEHRKPTRSIYRRRAAGPWEPVPQEGTDR